MPKIQVLRGRRHVRISLAPVIIPPWPPPKRLALPPPRPKPRTSERKNCTLLLNAAPKPPRWKRRPISRKSSKASIPPSPQKTSTTSPRRRASRRNDEHRGFRRDFRSSPTASLSVASWYSLSGDESAYPGLGHESGDSFPD